jgi:hypothetical protein
MSSADAIRQPPHSMTPGLGSWLDGEVLLQTADRNAGSDEIGHPPVRKKWNLRSHRRP